jgi:hypothetical protein
VRGGYRRDDGEDCVQPGELEALCARIRHNTACFHACMCSAGRRVASVRHNVPTLHHCCWDHHIRCVGGCCVGLPFALRLGLVIASARAHRPAQAPPTLTC